MRILSLRRYPSDYKRAPSWPGSFSLCLRCDREGECHTGTNFGQGVIIDATAAQADVQRGIVADLPDRPNQGRLGLQPAEITLVGELGDGTNLPIMRAF